MLRSISNDYSRNIILSVISRPRSIEQIAEEEQIPTSTCYRRVCVLEAHGIIRRHEMIVEEGAKKIVRYSSPLKSATINVTSGEVTIKVVADVPGEDTLHWMWSAINNGNNESLVTDVKVVSQ